MKPIFFFSCWKSDIDENGSLNYHTTHKNYQKTCYKIGYGPGTLIFRTKFPSARKNISHSMGTLINQIVVFVFPENPQVIEERPLHLGKVTVWCALWSEGVIDCGWDVSKIGRKLSQKNKCLQHFAWR